MSEQAIFTVEQTHGRVLRSGNELISHSPEVGWRSLHAATFREAPLRARELAIGHASLIYHIKACRRVRAKLDKPGAGNGSATVSNLVQRV